MTHTFKIGASTCDHCWHTFNGTSMIVLQPGFVQEQCCKCQAMRVVHSAHQEGR